MVIKGKNTNDPLRNLLNKVSPSLQKIAVYGRIAVCGLIMDYQAIIANFSHSQYSKKRLLDRWLLARSTANGAFPAKEVKGSSVASQLAR